MERGVGAGLNSLEDNFAPQLPKPYAWVTIRPLIFRGSQDGPSVLQCCMWILRGVLPLLSEALQLQPESRLHGASLSQPPYPRQLEFVRC